MGKQLILNLPVKDLDRSVAFFTHLGYGFNPQFTDENATCLVIDEECFVMLLKEEYFQTFTDRKVIDTSAGIQALYALGVESREEVDEHVRRAGEAGGSIPRQPVDHGFMYQHGFEDPDGHYWEVVYMDMSALPWGEETGATA